MPRAAEHLKYITSIISSFQQCRSVIIIPLSRAHHFQISIISQVSSSTTPHPKPTATKELILLPPLILLSPSPHSSPSPRHPLFPSLPAGNPSILPLQTLYSTHSPESPSSPSPPPSQKKKKRKKKRKKKLDSPPNQASDETPRVHRIHFYYFRLFSSAAVLW